MFRGQGQKSKSTELLHLNLDFQMENISLVMDQETQLLAFLLLCFCSSTKVSNDY